ncbi:MAG: hypothetical protein BWY31_03569 [Lentisphaerae bacterium ADurb.Bin242]|nr:MAG: hypothetical protein BWY31_03569 [Lentisphaerae bacterium ADurb.Bin242]
MKNSFFFLTIALSSLFSVLSAADFTVTVLSGMDKVFPEIDDFSFPLGWKRAEIAAAGRESENFQVALIPLAKALDGVSVTVRDLRMEDGKIFPAGKIVWHRVGYVRTKSGTGTLTRTGRRWPDVLMPGEPFSVARGFVGSVFFTVTVPTGTPIGVYRGFIDFNAAGAEKQSVLLELTVRSFDLPLRGKLRTQFSFHPGTWEAWYHPERAREAYGVPASAPAGSAYGNYFHDSAGAKDLLSEKDWFRVYDFLLAHRLSPVFIYNWNSVKTPPRIFPPLEHLSYCYGAE